MSPCSPLPSLTTPPSLPPSLPPSFPAQVAKEHIEILVQFGYVSMFAVAFPLAPILALLNNLWEARLDLLKLKVRRDGGREGGREGGRGVSLCLLLPSLWRPSSLC